jgi:acyl-CoA reductase-like NAD-dependent aldehyde dehydrogenase
MTDLITPTAAGAVEHLEHLYIGGEWVPARSGATIESINPATGELWATVPEAGPEDIDAAVTAARTALESREWRSLSATERGKLLRRLADRVRDHSDQLAAIESRDNGKAIRETREREMPAVAEWLDYFGGIADKVQGDTIPVGPELFAYTIREPVGVVGAILPWNSPLLMVSWKLGPALAAGNTVVIKPAELTSVTALELMKLVEEVGIPAGVVNVVPGYGHSAGAVMSAHEGIDKLAFTGEGATARAITQGSTSNLKRLSFELGGKAPHIIFSDADYEMALMSAVEGAFIAAGQTCAAGSRVLVQEDIFDRFVADFVAKAKAVRVGDPLDERTQMGAQTSAEQLKKIEQHVADAHAAGAEILCGGQRATVPGFEGGFFHEPTVVVDVDPGMRVWQEEIFGPVVVIAPFKDEEDAIRLANSTRYGLTSGVWTSNLPRAHRMISAIRAGVVWVNTYRVTHWAMPFGGVKQSGYGREHGFEVMDVYTETKTVLIDNRQSRTPWFS